MQTLKSKSSNSLEQFNELMEEVAKLPEETRSMVSVYSQGILAMANMQNSVRSKTEICSEAH